MSKKRFKGKLSRTARQIESLENRELLAGDLVAYWNASDHVAATTSNVESWTDNLGIVATTAVGVPQWAEDGLGGRPVIRFDAADGVDALAVDKADSPVAGANDFSVVVAFATASQDLVGGQAEWFKNSAIVDGSNGGFTQDWGISINASGQVTAGMGSDFLSPSVTVRSQATGLNNGQLQVATLTRSGGNLSLYVNDGTPSTVTGASTAARANLGISIGQLLTSGNGFTGDIGQIRIYDGQLSAAEVNQVYSEIQAYYNNQTPVANADQYQFEEDTFLGVVQVPGVLANDTDADGDSLTAILVEDVKHGALGLNPNGSFSYAPEANFHGTDTFTYTANDFRASQPTTVTITVTNKYDAAVAVSDSYKSLAGQLLNIPALVGVLANDINIDGATLTAELVQAPSAGSLTLNADGSFRYDPQGFAGSTSFQYRIFDGTGRSANATVQLVINTPPTAVNDSISIPEDSTLTLSSANGVLKNDVDAEGDALEITIITPPSLGSIEDNNGSLVYRPPLNYVGSDTFQYQLSDGVDSSNIATATLRMTPVNDAPTANDDTYFGKVDEAIVVTAAQSVLRNDTDIEGDALTASIVRQPTHGVVQFSSNGTFTYTPQAGFLGVDSFAYAASDGQASNQAEVKIAINSLAQQQQIVINEVHSDPNDKTNWVEFIELYNKGDQPVSLGGWVFTAGVDFTFPNDASIPAGGYVVVAQDAVMFQAEFDVTAMGQWEGTLRNSGERIELRSAGGDLIDSVDYKLGFPWPVVGEAPDKSLQLLNPEADNDLGGSWRSATPSPGVANTIRTDNIAPQMRQVEHSPQQPTDADDVTITVKVTDADGVQNVSLEYQIVSPGNYISITDDAYRTTWTSVAMYDDGTNGDAEANDSIYTVVLPASLNQHRHLVRYRISAVDTKGASVTGPYEDDPSPNFNYYVYNGLPTWTGADRPGSTDPVTYDFSQMEDKAVYQLITKNQDVLDAQYHPGTDLRSGYTGSEYQWEGTLIYDGKVYDHIRYRARGGVWRYAMGKNMWKFDFNRGHSFQAKDDYGNEYDTEWDKLNFSAIIQQGDFDHRGEQGLFEAVGFKLFNLMDVEAPNTNYVHFRVVDDAAESGESQYDGDFWGMYMAIEQPDGRMLDQHGLPDGNLYKIENYAGSSNNQGPTQPSNGSDVRDFIRAYRSGSPDPEWWEANLDLEKYYSYRSVVESIHHYDIAYGKNYFYYHNPETGKFEVHPWDLDLTWADNMYGDGNHDFKRKVADNDAFAHEYRNRLREYIDLLYNPEQTGMLIDEFASFIYTPGQASWVDADRAMWDYNPIMASRNVNSSKARQGRYYTSRNAPTKDFPGMIQHMKNYVVSRTDSQLNRRILDDDEAPVTPRITYVGDANYAIDGLQFATGAFSDPQGDAFSAMEWRIAEVTDPNSPTFDRTQPRKYEITSLWESGEISSYDSNMTVPGSQLVPGATYRVRVRMEDATGRWSHWSDPIQFVASEATGTEIADSLRISEVHYHPADPTTAEVLAGFDNSDEFEFLEFVNIGSTAIDLSSVTLVSVDIEGESQGVDFDFSTAASTMLNPGETILVVENADAFQLRYGDQFNIAGEWSGRLSNGGETLSVATYGQVFQQFAYADDWYVETDGAGPSLELVNPNASDLSSWNLKDSWRSSSADGGSPGSIGAQEVPGDSNHDGVFNSSDLVIVFTAGEYEDSIVGNSTFEEGDWNHDGDFTTADLVYAFQAGTYVANAVADSSRTDSGNIESNQSVDDVFAEGNSFDLRTFKMGMLDDELKSVFS